MSPTLWCVVFLLSLQQCLPGNVACGLPLLDQVGSFERIIAEHKLYTLLKNWGWSSTQIVGLDMVIYGTCCVFLEDEAWKTSNHIPRKFNSLTVETPKGKDPFPSINESTLQARGALDPRRMSRFQQLLPPKNACDIATCNGMDGGRWRVIELFVCFFNLIPVHLTRMQV